MDAHNSILVDLSRLPSRQARLVNTSVLMDAVANKLARIVSELLY